MTHNPCMQGCARKQSGTTHCGAGCIDEHDESSRFWLCMLTRCMMLYTWRTPQNMYDSEHGACICCTCNNDQTS
jgi:hypothetical protein